MHVTTHSHITVTNLHFTGKHCNQLHKKCDGQKPCARCLKKGIECIYLPPKKRGPKTGKLTKSKKTHRKAQTKHKTNWKNTLGDQVISPQIGGAEYRLYFSTLLYNFVDVYLEYDCVQVD